VPRTRRRLGLLASGCAMEWTASVALAWPAAAPPLAAAMGQAPGSRRLPSPPRTIHLPWSRPSRVAGACLRVCGRARPRALNSKFLFAFRGSSVGCPRAAPGHDRVPHCSAGKHSTEHTRLGNDIVAAVCAWPVRLACDPVAEGDFRSKARDLLESGDNVAQRLRSQPAAAHQAACQLRVPDVGRA
jgi:hypothetical protein